MITHLSVYHSTESCLVPECRRCEPTSRSVRALASKCLQMANSVDHASRCTTQQSFAWSLNADDMSWLANSHNLPFVNAAWCGCCCCTLCYSVAPCSQLIGFAQLLLLLLLL